AIDRGVRVSSTARGDVELLRLGSRARSFHAFRASKRAPAGRLYQGRPTPTRRKMAVPGNLEGGAVQLDLLIKGGEVVDPGANQRGRLDVGIAGGTIAAVD